jgi:TonB family protein
MPCDLKQARVWAIAAIDARIPQGATMLAQIDSVAAPTAAERTAAHTKLIELADAGDAGAAMLLLKRAKDGLGESGDGACALAHLEKDLRLLPNNSPSALFLAKQIADTKRVLAATAAATPSPKVIAERIARIENARDPNGDYTPALVYSETPRYPPPLHLATTKSGEAQVEFVVKPDGTPANVHCVSSSHPLFAIAAEHCIKKWRFAPGRKEGRAVAMRMIQPFSFNLKD